MEIGNVSGNKGQTNNKLSLEEYQICVQSRSFQQLSVKQLNQIINMHGYAKPPKFNKKNLIEAVRTLDLVDLSRSTLGEYISPPLVSPSVDEVTADLAELGWLDDEWLPDSVVCVSSSTPINGVVLETATGKKKKVQGPNSAAGQAGAKKQRKGKKNTSAASVGGSSEIVPASVCGSSEIIPASVGGSNESLERTVRVPAISSKIFDNLPKEYSWRHLRQGKIKGSPYRKTYYTCKTVSGCPARIDVMRAPDDPAMLIVTYKGEHRHAPDNMSGGI